jgi:hypothetical protein
MNYLQKKSNLLKLFHVGFYSNISIKKWLNWHDLSLKFVSSTFAIAIVFLIFQEPINQIIKTYIVPLTSHIESKSVKFNIIFVFLFFFIIGFAIHKKLKEYTISAKQLLILTWVTVFYVFTYRTNAENKWKITETGVFPTIKFLDLIIAWWFFDALLFIRHFRTYKRVKNTKFANSFYEDNKASFSEIDILKRKEIATSLLEYISNTKNDKAFAIGVTGGWGFGKSVFLNFLKEEIKGTQEKEYDWIIIDFNPWQSENPKAIIKDFFSQLIEEINPYSQETATQLKNYFKELVSLDNSGLNKLLEKTNNVLADDISLSSQLLKIQASIQKLDKRLIVFVDDVDRLDNEEILEVLRVVRNTADFPSTFYLLAYDKNYITKAISDNRKNSTGNYLEKIIQFEITLPNIDPQVIKDCLVEKLQLHLQETELIKLKRIIYYNLKLDLTKKYICNLRDVIRFTNNFIFNYAETKKIEDIKIEQFFLLELIKYRDFAFYSKLTNIDYRSTFLKEVNRASDILLSIK